MESKKILWIEDEPFIGIDTRIKMLEDKGYNVTLIISNIDEALKCLKENVFNLILLDVMMPPGDTFTTKESNGGFETGLALARKLRNEHTNIPIIVITGYPNAKVEKEFREILNVKYFLTKPLSQVELERAINEVFGV